MKERISSVRKWLQIAGKRKGMSYCGGGGTRISTCLITGSTEMNIKSYTSPSESWIVKKVNEHRAAYYEEKALKCLKTP